MLCYTRRCQHCGDDSDRDWIAFLLAFHIESNCRPPMGIAGRQSVRVTVNHGHSSSALTPRQDPPPVPCRTYLLLQRWILDISLVELALFQIELVRPNSPLPWRPRHIRVEIPTQPWNSEQVWNHELSSFFVLAAPQGNQGETAGIRSTHQCFSDHQR